MWWTIGIGAFRMVAQVETTSASRPLYPLPRYDEGWSFLTDPSKHDNLWDPLKFIRLSSSGHVFLSVGGEARETYETSRRAQWAAIVWRGAVSHDGRPIRATVR